MGTLAALLVVVLAWGLVLQRHLDVRLVVVDRGGGSDRRGLGVVGGGASPTSAACW